MSLPVDARPAKFVYRDGAAPSNRRQPLDGTLGLEASEKTCLHKEVLTGKGQSQQIQTRA